MVSLRGIMAERRRFTRIPRSLVTYYRRLDEGVPERAAVTRDVSRGGILVELDPPVDVGEMLALEMVLGDAEPPVNLVGRVVRVNAEGTAIEFVQLDGVDVDRIHRFVSSRRGGSGPGPGSGS